MNHILAPADIAHYYSRLAQPSTLPAAPGRARPRPAPPACGSPPCARAAGPPPRRAPSMP
jgi:hypothetical protein